MLDTYRELATTRNIGILTGITVVLLGIYFFTGLSSAAPTETQVYKACQDRCSQIQEAEGQRKAAQIYDYCKDTYNIKTGTFEGAQLKENQTEYCSEGAKCPNLHTCETQQATLDIQGCIDYMTQYHRATQGEDQETAQQHTQDLMETGLNSCEQKPEWHQEAFNQ